MDRKVKKKKQRKGKKLKGPTVVNIHNVNIQKVVAGVNSSENIIKIKKLLLKHAILSSSISKDNEADNVETKTAFEEGVLRVPGREGRVLYYGPKKGQLPEWNDEISGKRASSNSTSRLEHLQNELKAIDDKLKPLLVKLNIIQPAYDELIRKNLENDGHLREIIANQGALIKVKNTEEMEKRIDYSVESRNRINHFRDLEDRLNKATENIIKVFHSEREYIDRFYKGEFKQKSQETGEVAQVCEDMIKKRRSEKESCKIVEIKKDLLKKLDAKCWKNDISNRINKEDHMKTFARCIIAHFKEKHLISADELKLQDEWLRSAAKRVFALTGRRSNLQSKDLTKYVRCHDKTGKSILSHTRTGRDWGFRPRKIVQNSKNLGFAKTEFGRIEPLPLNAPDEKSLHQSDSHNRDESPRGFKNDYGSRALFTFDGNGANLKTHPDRYLKQIGDYSCNSSTNKIDFVKQCLIFLVEEDSLQSTNLTKYMVEIGRRFCKIIKGNVLDNALFEYIICTMIDYIRVRTVEYTNKLQKAHLDSFNAEYGTSLPFKQRLLKTTDFLIQSGQISTYYISNFRRRGKQKDKNKMNRQVIL